MADKSERPHAGTRPNFLVIVADDLGFSDVGAFGGEIKTPNIDSLAHIAGLGTMIETIKEFQVGQPGYEGYLNDRIAALPELLRDAGYFTLMSGKWHLGMTPDRYPSKRGFDRSFSLLPGGANHYGWEPQVQEKVPDLLERNGPFYAEDDKPVSVAGLGPDFYSSESFTSKLLQYFQERGEGQRQKPFFAYLPYSAPHWPLQAPEEDCRDYRGVYDEGPDVLRQKRLRRLEELGIISSETKAHEVFALPLDKPLSKEWKSLTEDEKKFSSRTMEVFAAMVQNMDRNIGRVLSYLKSTGEYDNTLVMFMSDNGAEGLLLEAYPVVKENIFDHIDRYYDNSYENMGRYNSYIWYGPRWASAAMAPLRLYKSFSSEGGIRVPFILRYPPLTSSRAGRLDRSFATVMDIAPTLLQLAGTEHPGTTYRGRAVVPMRGTSWVPYLSDPVKRPYIHGDDSVMGWELFDRQALRKGKWKAVMIPRPFGPGRWQLYDLERDPGETDDLGARHPEKLQELLKHWDEYCREVGVAGAAPQYGMLRVDQGDGSPLAAAASREDGPKI
ncbi:arylsulfatase [Cladophialophora psammophila CBS 110553]|uniref:Arylsulfatase n=1 Tax=Cladophialophora psammophila CBS 110553 TaxID=1182543 RepID=W9X438_9EURO|nr:arylsulfatase [Cladophialophora psammophila CBS 110553]EXJ75252.1 arylsulfatase [Cladophialophora psammophila CBS 110553]